MSREIMQEVLLAIAAGDNEVFGRLFSENYYPIKTSIKRLIKIDADAEELTQDVFLKLWEKREDLVKIDPPSAFGAYLRKMSYNVTMDYISKKASGKRYIESEKHSSDFLIDFEDQYNADETLLLIKLIVSQMPPKQRMVFEMSRFKGVSNDQIASELNISKKTVVNYITTALREIKKVILIATFIFSDKFIGF